jgi:hypothetical protein
MHVCGQDGGLSNMLRDRLGGDVENLKNLIEELKKLGVNKLEVSGEGSLSVSQRFGSGCLCNMDLS